MIDEHFVEVWRVAIKDASHGLNFGDPEDRAIFRGKVEGLTAMCKVVALSELVEFWALMADDCYIDTPNYKGLRTRRGVGRALADLWMRGNGGWEGIGRWSEYA